MSIEKQLGIKFPIYWNDWPIEKEFAKYLVYEIITNRPINIVELGGGTSSLIILKTLEKLGYEYVFTSIDSNKQFLEKTKNLLISEDIYNEKKVKLLCLPLSDMEINSNIYRWYNSKDLKLDLEKIDLLFVDGPVGGIRKNTRYPAIPVFKKYLKEGSLVVLHDAKRPDETEVVKMWEKENMDIININRIETERGGVEIQF